MTRAGVVWLGAASVAVALCVWVAFGWHLRDIAPDCWKFDESLYGYCGDRLIDVYNVGGLAALLLFLAVPPAIAAVAERTWVSWAVVDILATIFLVALILFPPLLHAFLMAGPVALIGVAATVLQVIDQARRRREAPPPSAGTAADTAHA